MKRIIAAILCLILVAGLFAGCAETAEFTPDPITRPEFENKTAYSDKDVEKYVLAAEKGGLKLFFNPSTTHFMVENTADGSVWYSNPQDAEEDEYASQILKMQMNSTLVVEYTNIETKKITALNLYTSSVRSKKYNINLVQDGVLFEYEVGDIGKRFFLSVRLGDDNVYTDVWCEELENGKEGVLVSAVSVTPFFVSGKLGDQGYLMLPDGSGALVGFNKDKITADSYSRPIYGEEPTAITRDWYLQATEQSVKLPVYGVCKNGSAMMAIAESSAEIGTMRANACGQSTSYANAFISYNTLSSIEYDLGKYTTMIYNTEAKEMRTLTTRYYFLDGENADYSGMARKYRDYLAEKYSLPANTVHDTLYTDIYGGVLKKISTLGVPHNTFLALTDAEALLEMCNKMKESGAGDITVRYRNWNKNELNGKRVDSAKAPSTLSFDKLASIEGVTVYPAVTDMQSYTFGGFFDALSNATFSITGLPFSMNGYLKSNLRATDSVTYWVATTKLAGNAQGLMIGLADKGFKNIAFSDIASKLYSDYRDNTYLRDDSKQVMNEILKKADESFEGVMTDRANDYAAVVSDVIYNTPVSHSNQDILEQSIPFYSIALGGLADCVAPSYNGEYADDEIMLKSAASGTYFCYSFMKEESSKLLSTELKSLTNMNFDTTFEDAMAAYSEMKKISTAAAGSRLYSHNYVTDTLTVTQYENGAKVYVNFSDKEATVDNITVSAKSFSVIGGKN